MRTPRTPLAVIGLSALVSLGGMTAMVAQGSPDSGAVAGEMSTGVTVTSTRAAVSKAAPAITGPAPLPAEEQGLPGD